MKILPVTFLVITTYSSVFAQQSVHTGDIDNFWHAFDKIQKISDTTAKDEMIQKLYLDKASEGLKEFIRIRNWNAAKFRKSITGHQAFWQSVRPLTLRVRADSIALEKLLSRYRQLYPNFITPQLFFTIGPISTGGTTTQDKVLIGTELASGDSSVDVSGLNPFIKGFFRTNPGIISLVAHELTHTQQKGGDMEDRRDSNLLGFCIAEGVCDFISELLLQKPVVRPYIIYGENHEKEIWAKFRKEMDGKDTRDWLYNGAIKKDGDADLGYFVGYAICKSYYEYATDKKTAIKEMISINLENKKQLRQFLENSKYGFAWKN
jgi:hypothetical protein